MITITILTLIALALSYIAYVGYKITKLDNVKKSSKKLSNSTTGTHAGNVTKIAAKPIDQRNLLVTVQGNQVAVAQIADMPFGIATDAPQAGEPTNVSLLGCASSSVKMIAAEPITAGQELTPAANGQVRPVPSESGVYLIIGVAINNAPVAQPVEVDPSRYAVTVK